MSSEHVSDLPDELREWVENHAAETDRDPTDVLTQAITAYQVLERDGDGLEANGAADVPAPLPAETELHDRLEAIDDRIAELESEIDEQIEDVRERVIQVKRETDAKAPADHDHRELQHQLLRTNRTAEEAAQASQQLRQRVDEGFDNFEDILEYLTDRTDELEEKLDALAHTVVDLQRGLQSLEGTASARAAAADLQSEANREGVTAAQCESCESTVRIGLLSTPHCPHCGTTFREVDPSTGLFGSSYLRTGDRPALEAGESNALDSPEDLFDEYSEESNG